MLFRRVRNLAVSLHCQQSVHATMLTLSLCSVLDVSTTLWKRGLDLRLVPPQSPVVLLVGSHLAFEVCSFSGMLSSRGIAERNPETPFVLIPAVTLSKWVTGRLERHHVPAWHMTHRLICGVTR